MNYAGIRTKLANERTALSYFRTACALWGLAMLVYKLFKPQLFTYIAIAFALAGFTIAFYGSYKFSRRQHRIHTMLID
jgi:uncharacterized membrane protein YidH (DUF202 family)